MPDIRDDERRPTIPTDDPDALTEASMRADAGKQAKFRKLAAGPYLDAVVAANRAYLRAAVPNAVATERTGWSLSCLPSTGSGRLSAISMRTMETFVLHEPEHPSRDAQVEGFMIVRRSRLFSIVRTQQEFRATFPGLTLTESDYRDAGDDQARISGRSDALIRALNHEVIAEAARDLAATLLTGRTMHGRGHNYQLADRVLDRAAPQPPQSLPGERTPPQPLSDDPGTATDGVRYGLLLRTCLEVLRDADGPTHGRTVLDEVARRIELNEAERRPQRTGQAAWNVAARFHTGDAATVGWLVKRDAQWWITDEGRQALSAYPDSDELIAEVGRRYRQVVNLRKQARKKYDSRLPTIVAALEQIPAGSWTAYDDLAELVGGEPEEIAHLLAEVQVPHAHRVLQADGQVPPARFQHVALRGVDLRKMLAEEGVEFAGRSANPGQRFTGELLSKLVEGNVEAPAPARRAWLVRGSNVDGADLVPEWLADGWVSLAASQLTNSALTTDQGQLPQLVDEAYRHKSYSVREQLTGNFDAFLHRMHLGDYLVTLHRGDVHLGIIDGDVSFVDSPDRRSNLRRPVHWLTADNSLDLTDLTGPLPTLIQSQDDLIDLTDALDVLERLYADLTAEHEQRPVVVEPVPEARLADLDEAFAAEILTDFDWLTELRELLAERRQVILYGPPGTGKTYLAQQLAERLTERHAVTTIQFHPSYTYEDFFEGFRPESGEDGTLRFKLTPGPLRTLADQAREHPSTAYILIIDEINRGNLAKIFGELYFLLEYRKRRIRLQYSHEEFTLPPNLYLIGTMNTADRSIALVDVAMRRRFAFVELHPARPPVAGLLRRWLDREATRAEELGGDPAIYRDSDAPALLDAVNARLGDPEHAIGPSHLMRPSVYTNPRGLDRVWRYDILPLLVEHHYADNLDVEQRYGLDSLRASLPPRP